MENGIEFRVIYEDTDMLELRVSAWNGAFGGHANVYVRLGHVEDVAAKLRGFPETPHDSREVSFGAFGPQSAGGGVSLRFYCIDGAAHAFVASRLESGEMIAGVLQSVLLALPVEAAAMDSFVDDLGRLGLERHGVALLRAAVYD
jgi:hypothetical protein